MPFIPTYNHDLHIAGVVRSLKSKGLEVFIVDDASEPGSHKRLVEIAHKEQATLLVHQENQGKGGAVMTGLKAAEAAGFSHALQVDADGQHNLDDVTAMLEVSKRHPDKLVSGRPVYDASIPKGRLYGRYVTHFWVWIETLSFAIKDTMCGFRVYPLASCAELFSKVSLGKRMDFDIEVMVRLYWQGVDVAFVPTKVIYPEDGTSHFQGFKDNVRISWLHTRLFFGMLPRIPSLLMRKAR